MQICVLHYFYLALGRHAENSHRTGDTLLISSNTFNCIVPLVLHEIKLYSIITPYETSSCVRVIGYYQTNAPNDRPQSDH